MLSPSSGNGGLVSGDNGTVGMAHKMDIQVEGAGVAVMGCQHWGGVGNSRNCSVGDVSRGVGHVGSCVVPSTSSKVVSAGGSNSGLISGDNSTIGVGNKGSVQVEGSTVAVGNNWSSMGNGRRVGNGNTNVATAGGKVVSTSCSNGRLINRNNSSIGMADKGSVQVEGSCIAVGNNWSSVGNNWGSVGNNWSSVGNNWSSTVGGSKCTQVFGTSCSNCRFINWNHCAIGVTHLIDGY